MRRRLLRFGLVGLLGLVGVLSAVSASTASATSWDNAIEVPGTAALNGGGHAEALSLSCSTANDCTAGGFYTDGSGRLQTFVVREASGVWGKAVAVPGTATLNGGGDARVTSVSCATAGNCAAGGYYSDLNGNPHAFVANETNGSWGSAIDVPGTGADSTLNSVSCATAGNCTAGGDFKSGSQAFVVDETNGSWGNAIEVPGSATLNSGGNAAVTSVSCATAGNCTAGGTYLDGPLSAQAFVVDETNGSWGNAIEVPGSATLNSGGYASVTSVSCATAGNCAAGGGYFDSSDHYQAFLVDETNGSWGNATEVPGSETLNSHGNARVNSVSCATDGNCAAGGKYLDGSDRYQAFLVDETNGSWGNATKVPGTGTLNSGGSAAVYSVSCVAAGECAAGGYYRGSSGQQAFVGSETGGVWSNAIQVPGSGILNVHGFASVRSVSCGAVGECGAGGVYKDGGSGAQAFVTAAGYYSLVYDGNGATGGSAPSDGSSPYTSGTPVTVPGAGSLTRTGYTFSGWTAAANGSGTSYLPGQKFPMPATNVILHARWINTSATVHCSQKARISNPGANLSGLWESNLSGTYYVRQIGSCIYWIGLGTFDSQSQRYDYVNAFFGTISSTGTTITGFWFDVNAVKTTLHGSLKLHVGSGSHFGKVAQTGGFSAASWTRQSSAAATFPSPSSSPVAVKNLAWTCDPTATAAPIPNYLPSTIAIPAIAGTTARYNVRQIGSCVIFWGRPRVSPVPPATPKWTYSQLFFGRSTGSGLSEVVTGPWANVPAGTAHGFGQLTLTLLGGHAFRATGTGGWVTTVFNHTP